MGSPSSLRAVEGMVLGPRPVPDRGTEHGGDLEGGSSVEMSTEKH